MLFFYGCCCFLQEQPFLSCDNKACDNIFKLCELYCQKPFGHAPRPSDEVHGKLLLSIDLGVAFKSEKHTKVTGVKLRCKAQKRTPFIHEAHILKK